LSAADQASCALGGTRTPNLLIRSQMLSPIELRAPVDGSLLRKGMPRKLTLARRVSGSDSEHLLGGKKTFDHSVLCITGSGQERPAAFDLCFKERWHHALGSLSDPFDDRARGEVFRGRFQLPAEHLELPEDASSHNSGK
jgi:hypothetical protein